MGGEPAWLASGRPGNRDDCVVRHICRAYGLRPCHGGGYRQYYDSIPCENGYPIKTAAGMVAAGGRTGADYSAQYSDDYLRGNHERIHPKMFVAGIVPGVTLIFASDWSQCGNCSA